MTARTLNLGTGRPAKAPAIQPGDVLRALLSLQVGDTMRTEVGDITRNSDSSFQLSVTPNHFRGALDALMSGGA